MCAEFRRVQGSEDLRCRVCGISGLGDLGFRVSGFRRQGFRA